MLVGKLPATLLPKSKPLSVGRVRAVRGTSVFAELPSVAIGDMCRIARRGGGELPSEVVAIAGDCATLAPLGSTTGVYLGARVESDESRATTLVGEHLLGRVVDPFCNAIDNKSPLEQKKLTRRSVYNNPPPPLERAPLATRLHTGIRSIDACLPIAYGQRLCIMAQAGVGKSTLLGMLVRNADIDVAVIALVGERGREVREFIEETLGEEGLQRSVVVVATSDQPSMLRQLAPYTATTIAEYFREKGLRVLLVVDSLTRMARAMRDTGLAAGEPPVRHGYPPSVYTELPRLLERAGNAANGSITAVYTLLIESEELPDPLAEEIKSILDGHILLSAALASSGQRPAIKITQSVSRCASRLASRSQEQARNLIIRALSRLERERDLILLGGIPDPELKKILDVEDDIRAFLHQNNNEVISLVSCDNQLLTLSQKLLR